MEKHGSLNKWSKEMEVVDEGSIMARSDEESDNAGVGRTYECNYCKRGFTNAQALGGHMNIHRKDKAKARQQQQQPPFSSSSSISFKEPISGYSSSFVPQRNYQGYFPFSNNPSRFSSQASIYDGNHNFTRLFGMYDDHLRISTSNIDQYQRGGKQNNKQQDYDDIDLELRLGYHP